jgi:hypothetical protein
VFLVKLKTVENERYFEMRFEMNAAKYSWKLPPLPQVKCEIDK